MMTDQPEKPGSPPCGLYYRVSGDWTLEDARFYTRQMAMVVNARSGYEKNMCVVEISAAGVMQSDISQLVEVIQGAGLVAIIRDDIGAVQAAGADGVMLGDVSAVGAARKALGEEAIIGAACLSSKDTAQKALEAGADFVSFGTAGYAMPDVKLLSWWAERGEGRPALALGDITNDSAGLLAGAGAGFLDITSYADTLDEGIMKATVNMLYALKLAD